MAVGTTPYRPAHIGFDGVNVLDSDEILDITRIPRQLVVVGASVIGVEYASIFSALDVKVTLVEPNSGLLPFLDRELSEEFTHDLRDRGVALRFNGALDDGKYPPLFETERAAHGLLRRFDAQKRHPR